MFEKEFGVEGEDEEEEVGMLHERGRVAELRKMARENEDWESFRAVAGIREKRRQAPRRSYSLCEGGDF